MSEKPSSPLAHLPWVELERAAVDLRRGLPIIVAGTGRGVLALSPETATAETLSLTAQLAPKGALWHMALTETRAETLKIRRYTPGAIAVPLVAGVAEALKKARLLADPSDDLAHPFGGPYPALRDLGGRTLAPALKTARVAGLLPALLWIDLEAEDAAAFAAAQHLSLVTPEAAETYDAGTAETLKLISRAKLPLEAAENAEIAVFRSSAGGPEHYAILIGAPKDPALVRVHSECFTGDLLGSLKCDCGDQLRGALDAIAKEGAGVLLYLAQEGRGIGLPNKLRAYRLQDQGFDTVEANTRLGFEVDERFFDPAAKMLGLLGIGAVRLMTNNPAKVAALETCGVKVTERVAHSFPTNAHNEHYLLTKRDRTGHLI